MKPFVEEPHNGGKNFMSAEDVARTVDESAATRLAVIMFNKGNLTPSEFLDVIRPVSHYGSIRATDRWGWDRE